MAHPALINLGNLPLTSKAMFGSSFFATMDRVTSPQLIQLYATIGPFALACMTNGPPPSDMFPRPTDEHVNAILAGITAGTGHGRLITLQVGVATLTIPMTTPSQGALEIIQRTGLIMVVGAIVAEDSFALSRLRTEFVRSGIIRLELEVALRTRVKLREALPYLKSLWDMQVELLIMAETGARTMDRPIRKCVANLGIQNMTAVLTRLKSGGRIAARWETYRDAIAYGAVPTTMTYFSITPNLTYNRPGNLGRDLRGQHEWI